VKLNQGVSGEGNAILDIAGLPAPGTAAERACIVERLSTVAPDGDLVSGEAYLAKLAAGGGIIEERIEGQDIRSPSVQFEVAPDGRVKLISTHDQILGGPGGQHYLGCRLPADPSYAPAISSLARRVAHRLADMGVIGRFSVDFVVARQHDGHWEPYALELNLRSGGTTHPYQALARLGGGTYDARSATFTAADGNPRHYVATDYLQTPQRSALGRDRVVALAQREDLRFDRRPGRRSRLPHALLDRRVGPRRRDRDRQERRGCGRDLRARPGDARTASASVRDSRPDPAAGGGSARIGCCGQPGDPTRVCSTERHRVGCA
jgi:hypothetical protein